MSKAIFLGSFNPPHKGHYNCIKSVVESGQMKYLCIDKIHIIPCYQNPNKSKTLEFIYRYKMCRMLFEDLIADGKVLIDDIEEEMMPNYTITLFDYFHSNSDAYIKDDFWWIITVETLNELLDNKWKNSTQLLHENKFIVVYGQNDSLARPIQLIREGKLNATSVKLIEEVDYHSTELRNKVKEGILVEKETNKRIQEYIKANNLYNE